MDDLKNLVKNKTVAIVGPSPHLVNTGLGEFIDSHDLVIRINEILPSGYFQDYGSKTDIVFLNLGNDWLEITIEMINKDIKALDDIKLFVNPRNSLDVSTKNRFKKDPNQNVFNNFKKLKVKNNFFHIGNDKNKEFEDKVGTFPTTGLLTIMSILECEFTSLFVCGFSFYSTKYRYNPNKSELYKKYGYATTGIAGHDMLNEINYLKSHFPRRKNIKVDYLFNLLIYMKIHFRYIKYVNSLIHFFRKYFRFLSK